MQKTKNKNALNGVIKGIKGKIAFNATGGIVLKNNTPLSSLGSAIKSTPITTNKNGGARVVKNGISYNFYKALNTKGTINTLDFLGSGATKTTLNTLYNRISVLMYCGLITPYKTFNTTVNGNVLKGVNNHTVTVNKTAITQALKNGLPKSVNGVVLSIRHIAGGNAFLNAINGGGVV